MPYVSRARLRRDLDATKSKEPTSPTKRPPVPRSPTKRRPTGTHVRHSRTAPRPRKTAVVRRTNVPASALLASPRKQMNVDVSSVTQIQEWSAPVLARINEDDPYRDYMALSPTRDLVDPNFSEAEVLDVAKEKTAQEIASSLRDTLQAHYFVWHKETTQWAKLMFEAKLKDMTQAQYTLPSLSSSLSASSPRKTSSHKNGPHKTQLLSRSTLSRDRFVQNAPLMMKGGSVKLPSHGLGPLTTRVIVDMMLSVPTEDTSALGSLTSFNLLDLSGNELHDSGAMVLAGFLSEDKRLTTLNICDTGMGPSGFSALFDSLADFNRTLTHLDVSSNNVKGKMLIGVEGAQSLRVALEKNDTLSHLNLRGISLGLGGDEEPAFQLGTALQTNSNLRLLDLSHNFLEFGHISLLCHGFARNKRFPLETLLLKGNLFGSPGAAILAGVLKRCPQLTHLDLGNNKIDLHGILVLLQLQGAHMNDAAAANASIQVRSKSSSSSSESKELSFCLKTLVLSNNPLGSCNTYFASWEEQYNRKEQAKQVNAHKRKAPVKRKKGETMQVYDQRRGQSRAPQVHHRHAATMDFLRDKLSHLRLTAGEFRFTDGFCIGPNLESLVLTNCRLDDNMVNELVRFMLHDEGSPKRVSIHSMSRLKSLKLNHNNIHDEGAIALARFLRHDHTLTHLDLSSNRIKDEGGLALFDSLLVCNRTLCHLSLQDNKVREDTGRRCLVVLSRNDVLIDVFIKGNPMNYDMLMCITKASSTKKRIYMEGEVKRLLVEKDNLLTVKQKVISAQANTNLLSRYLEKGKIAEEALTERHQRELDAHKDVIESYQMRLRGLSSQTIEAQIYTAELDARKARLSSAYEQELRRVKAFYEEEKAANQRLGMEAVVKGKANRDAAAMAEKRIDDLSALLKKEKNEINGLQMELSTANAELMEFFEKLNLENEARLTN